MRARNMYSFLLVIAGVMFSTSIFAQCCPGSCCVFSSHKSAEGYLKKMNKSSDQYAALKIVPAAAKGYFSIRANKKPE